MGEKLAEKFSKFKNVYLLESHRIDSFKKWPYDETTECSISKMAQAGFYWSGSKNDDDTVTCFVCGKTLHGWDPTDDPWKEHAKHAPQCQFVKYGHKEVDMTVSFLFSASKYICLCALAGICGYTVLFKET